jgi:hypothetical protein
VTILVEDYREVSLMTPNIPVYLEVFESAIRPFVTAIALGLIWTGAYRMEGPARSRYTAAGALSVILLAWLTIAQYLGEKNIYFATSDTALRRKSTSNDRVATV